MRDWAPAAGVAVAIFWLSSQSTLPSPPDTVLNFLLKKTGHLVAYAALALMCLRGLHRTRGPFLWAFLLAVLYGAGDELHQSVVPGREASLRDVAIDAAGAGAALLGTRWAIARRPGWLGTALRRLTGLRG